MTEPMPPGWYAFGLSWVRYWDGEDWTDDWQLIEPRKEWNHDQ